MDYEVCSALTHIPVNWYDEATKGAGTKDAGTNDAKKKGPGKNADKDTVYRSSVWLQRKGEFVMPVEVEIVFRDSDDHLEKVREHWDGVSRWTKFAYEKKAKVISAEIDPDHKIQIDGNDFNNSKTVEPNGKPARKLTNYWVFVSQWIAQALAWWAV
jgi:hypothetical protein